MTPLASRFAKQLTLPIAQRDIATDKAGILSKISEEMHCFDIGAIFQSVHSVATDDATWNDVATMLPGLFLPSPITWLECSRDGFRFAYIIESDGEGWTLSVAYGYYSFRLCHFVAKPAAYAGGLVKVTEYNDLDEIFDFYKNEVLDASLKEKKSLSLLETELALAEGRIKVCKDQINLAEGVKKYGLCEQKTAISFVVIALNLINTPGIVGLKQHSPHKGLQRKLNNVGRYPLRGWSEIVLKHNAVFASGGSNLTGPAFHKCFHFVRSHLRRLHCGRTIVIPAHWRGDPALGIKQTRYKVAA